jgi:hypothetical protein
MFRFLAYALIGYTLYHLIQGMISAAPRDSRSDARGDLAPGEKPNIGALTGGGRGQRVWTEDAASGASVPHRVGRGVL